MRNINCVLKDALAYAIIALLSTQLMAAKFKPDELNQAIIAPPQQAKARVLLTNESARRLMSQNKNAAIKKLKAHIESLQWAITNNKLNEHDTYKKYLDASANSSRANQLLSGIRNIYRVINTKAVKFKVACYPYDIGYERYGWASYPWINFCNMFEDKVAGKVGIGWYFHEISHFPEPYGMAAVDHTHSLAACFQFAQSEPLKAITTAHCINSFLMSSAPDTVKP